MNVYIRYFDHETVAHSIDEIVEFLASIDDIQLTQEILEDIQKYVNSDIPYPKRYKIRPRIYFILIKTNAKSLEEFHNNRSSYAPSSQETQLPQSKKDAKTSQLQEDNPGWYYGSIQFKRVTLIPGTTKFQYQDTLFSAYVKAQSGQDCYNKIISHLKNRQDVDLRSQFPSAKGSNFSFEYVGSTLPTA